MNLYNQLTEQDNKIIFNYVTTHGIVPQHYIGNRWFLRHWSKAKSKLYHLLGNQFIYKIPFQYEQNASELREQIRRMKDTEPFVEDFQQEMMIMCNKEILSSWQCNTIYNCLAVSALYDNQIPSNIKLDLPDKKALLIPSGTKPMKALVKLLKYFDLEEKYKQSFENFRVKLSMCLNTKTIKGNLVISIHPMDFLTMSDNDYNWSSCMSWKNHGCYFLGTQEMMNSNNVVCCYLESEKHPLFCFADGKQDDDTFYWSSKKWRALFYVDKNIILSGKSYPYNNTECRDILLKELRALAKANMGWTYQFGPQEYLDMKQYYADDLYSLRYEAEAKGSQYSILLDTQAMYNDFINDHIFESVCVRNKVSHTKIISVSGPTACLCCGGEVKMESDECYSYNERIANAGLSVCEKCWNDFFKCENCAEWYLDSESEYTIHLPRIQIKNVGCTCEKCVKQYIKICPECGEPFSTQENRFGDGQPTENIVLIKDSQAQRPVYQLNHGSWHWTPTSEMVGVYGGVLLCMCPQCQQKNIFNGKPLKSHSKFSEAALEAQKQPYQWTPISHYLNRDYFITEEEYDLNDPKITKFFFENVKAYEPEQEHSN